MHMHKQGVAGQPVWLAAMLDAAMRDRALLKAFEDTTAVD